MDGWNQNRTYWFKWEAIDPFRADVKIVTAPAGGKTKQKLEAANSKQRRFGYTRCFKYNLVVMLGARIDVVEALIWNFNAYLLSLPDKKITTAVVKRDKTSGQDRKHHQKDSRLQLTLLIRKGLIKYCLLLLWARLKISCMSCMK